MSRWGGTPPWQAKLNNIHDEQRRYIAHTPEQEAAAECEEIAEIQKLIAVELKKHVKYDWRPRAEYQPGAIFAAVCGAIERKYLAPVETPDMEAEDVFDGKDMQMPS